MVKYRMPLVAVGDKGIKTDVVVTNCFVFPYIYFIVSIIISVEFVTVPCAVRRQS